MKRTMILNMSVLLVLAAAVNAQPADEGKTCSNETLKGSYGGTISGTRPAPTVIPGLPTGLQGQLEQAIGLTLWDFDGKGGFTQSISGKGVISGPGDLAVSGTYTVNANCTATVRPIVPGLGPGEIRMVIVDGGKEFRTFVVSPQSTMVVGHARKVN